MATAQEGGICSNITSLTARVINAPTTGATLPDITVPMGHFVMVRAHIDNTGRVYVADSQANATTSGVPGNRITLIAGDVLEMKIANPNVVWIAGSTDSPAQNVDLMVEQE